MQYTYDFLKTTCRMLKNAGFKPKNILDIGSNYCFAANIFRKTWQDAHIMLIEADKIFEPIYKNLNYDYIIATVGKSKYTSNFYKSKKDKYCMGSSIYVEQSNYYSNDSLIVETHNIIPIDSILTKNYDLIKIDIQGAELDAIIGGTNIFSNSKVIICEVSLIDYNKGGCSKQQIMHYLVNILKFDYVMTIETIQNSSNVTIQENLLFIKP